MNEQQALVAALRALSLFVDEEVPMCHRSRHLNEALAFAFELIEGFDEVTSFNLCLNE